MASLAARRDSSASSIDTDDDDTSLLYQAKDHPAWVVLEKSAAEACALPFVKHMKPLLRSVGGRKLGRGWQWRVFITGPKGTPYEGGTFRLHITVPDDFPKGQPSVRFHCLIQHMQVDALGFVVDHFRNVVPAPGHLAEVITTAHSMLLGELKGAPAITDEQIVHLWRNHDPECQCSLLPAPFKELVALFDRDEKAAEAMVEEFRHRFMTGVRPRQVAAKHHFMKQRLNAILGYKPLHPELFDADIGWQRKWFAPAFVEALDKGTPAALRALLTEESGSDVVSFDMFTKEYCDLLMEELKNYEASDFPKPRPNSMNNYGIVLNDMGFEAMFDLLLEDYLKPLAGALFPDVGGKTVDHHHSFMVQYKKGEDLNLDMHIDDSEVTFNINLLDAFTGANLAFCGLYYDTAHRKKQLEYHHKQGRAVVHRGVQRHGAMDITSGERCNLIVWCQSTIYRRSGDMKAHTQADKAEDPDAICLSQTHDPDFHVWEQVYAKQGIQSGVGQRGECGHGHAHGHAHSSSADDDTTDAAAASASAGDGNEDSTMAGSDEGAAAASSAVGGAGGGAGAGAAGPQ